jgi:ferrous iron transport protein B
MPNESPSDSPSSITIALIGNPNVGKSSLFGQLVGQREPVGNFPGVTVEKKVSYFSVEGRSYTLVDLPGLYSLSPQSLDEQVVVKFLADQVENNWSVDQILAVIDATSLNRNLYLVSQLIETGFPIVIALSKVDLARRQGMEIDLKKLEKRLNMPVVEIFAERGKGIDQLRQRLPEAKSPEKWDTVLGPEFSHESQNLAESLRQAGLKKADWLASRLLVDLNSRIEKIIRPALAKTNLGDHKLTTLLADARGRLAETGSNISQLETKQRYAWVDKILKGVVDHSTHERPLSPSDRIDRFITHPVWGMLIVFAMMFILFQSVFITAEPLVNWIGQAFDWLASTVHSSFAGTNLANGILENFLANGMVTGVGSVLTFLPQIMLLFLFIGLLEECGYMARAAFIMDRVMTRIGLNGKAFIPILSCFACAVPGIMATRVIGNRHARLTTILVAPFITCSARLPVYALLIGAFVPARVGEGGWIRLQGLTLFAMYLLGIVTAVMIAILLKKTAFRESSLPLLMELPEYQWPSIRTLAYRVSSRCWAFVKTAGTIILLVSIVIWASLYFPHNAEKVEAPFAESRVALLANLDKAPSSERPKLEASLALIDHQIEAAYRQQSYLGRLGKTVEPIFKPLGWDWRISCSVFASFPAREAVIASLGVIFVGEQPANLAEVDYPGDGELDIQLIENLKAATWEGTDRKLFTLPVALSLLVFYALSLQCAATIAVMRQETGSWRWPILAFCFSMVLAYAGSWTVYTIGVWLS